MAGFDPGLGREEAGYLDHCAVVQVTQLPPTFPRPTAHCTYDGSKQRVRICDFSSFAVVFANVWRHGNQLQPGQHQRWLLAAGAQRRGLFGQSCRSAQIRIGTLASRQQTRVGALQLSRNTPKKKLLA